MTNIDQIADEAKCEIARIMNNRDLPWTWSEVTGIIKSAIEKATEESRIELEETKEKLDAAIDALDMKKQQ